MIKICAEQLNIQLTKSLQLCYLLFGDDPLLQQESRNCIRSWSKKKQFNEYFSITLNAKTNWEEIFNLCQTHGLFTNRRMLLLILPDNGKQSVTSIGEKLLHLTSLLHKDLLLVICTNKLTSVLENASWFKALKPALVLVNCITPNKKQLTKWLIQRAKNMKLTLDSATNKLLCYYYEGNLLALAQILEQLSIIYPDGNLTLPRVYDLIDDAAHFSTFHLIDAVLAGKSKRAMHILRQLRLEAIEPIIILRNIQREILQLITIKKQLNNVKSMHQLFDQHKIWQNRRYLFTHILNRLTLAQLHDAILLMAHIELMLKQDYAFTKYLVWSNLKFLSLLLCGEILFTAIIDV